MNPPSAPTLGAPLAALTSVDVVSAQEVVGVKHIVATDPYLSGHYPGFPIYPGVFVVESARQAVAELVHGTRADRWCVEVSRLPAARFVAALLPGDVLRVHATCIATAEGELAAKVRCTRPGDERVADLELRLRLRPA